MTTSYSTIIDKFDDYISESEEVSLDYTVKEKYLRNSLSLFNSTISKIHYDNSTAEIEETLTDTEINLLGLLMYDYHLDQEILKYNRIINISNEFVRMTGAIDRVKTLKDMKLLNQQKINQILSGML